MSESSNDRRSEFEAQLAAVRVKTGSAETDKRWTTIGLIAAGAGIVITIVAFIVSGGQSDTRDVLSSVILALVGLGLTVLGSALFLRYSFGQYLRFWLLRMIYEEQADD
jgi:hypothetical protein